MKHVRGMMQLAIILVSVDKCRCIGCKNYLFWLAAITAMCSKLTIFEQSMSDILCLAASLDWGYLCQGSLS